MSGADVERRPICYRPTPRIRRWSIRWEYGRGEQAPVPRDGRRRPSTPPQPRPTCSGKTLSCEDLRRGLNRRPHEVAGADDRLCDAKNFFRKPPGRPRTSTGKSTGSPGEGREHEGGPRIPATRPPAAASMGAGSRRRFVPPERAPGLRLHRSAPRLRPLPRERRLGTFPDSPVARSDAPDRPLLPRARSFAMKSEIHPEYFPEAKVYFRGEVVMTVGADRARTARRGLERFAPVLHRAEGVHRRRGPRRAVPEEVRRRLLQQEEARQEVGLRIRSIPTPPVRRRRCRWRSVAPLPRRLPAPCRSTSTRIFAARSTASSGSTN